MATGRLDAKGVIVTCPSCGQQNRMPYAALMKSIRCATCKATLNAPGDPIEVPDSASFHAAASESSLPLIVDFWAPWCGPCRMVAPEPERVAQGARGRYLVLKVNTEVRKAIFQKKDLKVLKEIAVQNGMKTMRKIAIEDWKRGHTTLEEVLNETAPDKV